MYMKRKHSRPQGTRDAKILIQSKEDESEETKIIKI